LAHFGEKILCRRVVLLDLGMIRDSVDAAASCIQVLKMAAPLNIDNPEQGLLLELIKRCAAQSLLSFLV
jgi:hypothetical protein